MDHRFDKLTCGDCIELMRGLPDGAVDLAFADPPFNIGYDYDVYKDRKASNEYLRWSQEWMSEVVRILKPSGAFWLAIGDEYAAELKVLATRELGLHCRNWVVWYYTFGVHCSAKFTRSHAHLFYFVKDLKDFTFNDPHIRVPSARQLVYADKRANPKGRVPDDTWIIRPVPHSSWVLRPQDIPEGFSADSDTWYYPRVCGTFKERTGFHGCQMPEQILRRIIQACSNVGELVFDPFVGSGTTVAVAKKLNRRYLGFDLSQQYIEESAKRLSSIKSGAPLEGHEDPLQSAPSTVGGRRLNGHPGREHPLPPSSPASTSSTRFARRKVRGLGGLHRVAVEVFEQASDGFSVDRVIADPSLNRRFVEGMRERSAEGGPYDWNKALLTLRKSNRLRFGYRTRRSCLDSARVRACEFASEMAMAQMRARHDLSLDDILCDPAIAVEFDGLASEIAPGYDAIHYRWAALRIRKYSKDWRAYAEKVPSEYSRVRLRSGGRLLDGRSSVSSSAGIYQLKWEKLSLYIGETDDLEQWVDRAQESDFSQLCSSDVRVEEIELAVLPLDRDHPAIDSEHLRKGLKSRLIGRRRPRWNLPDLAA